MKNSIRILSLLIIVFSFPILAQAADLSIFRIGPSGTLYAGYSYPVTLYVHNDTNTDYNGTYLLDYGYYLVSNPAIGYSDGNLIDGILGADSTVIFNRTFLPPQSGTYKLSAAVTLIGQNDTDLNDNNSVVQLQVNDSNGPQPDLIEQNFSAVAINKTIYVGSTLMNNGLADATGTWIDRYEIYNAQNNLVASINHGPYHHLPPQGGSSEQGNFYNMAPGQYHVIAYADFNSQIAESNEFNNISDGFVTVSDQNNKPDLVISQLSAYVTGSTATITGVIANNGTATANAPWTDRYELLSDQNQVLSTQNRLIQTSLPAGNNFSEYPSFDNLSPGTYHIRLGVDTYNQVNESNESNNIQSGAYFTITDTNTLPDFNAENMSLNVYIDQVYISFWVYNRGNGTNDGNYVHRMLVISDTNQVMGTFDWNFATTGAPGTGVHLIQSFGPLPTGNYRAVGIADKFNTILESNENNNQISANFTIADTNLPDLRVNALEANGNGTTVNINSIVYNAGPGPANGTWNDQFDIYNSANQLVATAVLPRQGPFTPYTSLSESLTISNLAIGQYLLRETTDMNNQVAEMNEYNNYRDLNFTITGDSNQPGQPNLRFNAALEVLTIGSQKVLRIRYILDANAPVGPVSNRIHGAGPNPDSDAYFTNPLMQPGVEYIFDYNLSFNDNNRLITVSLDWNNSIAENNENDNMASILVNNGPVPMPNLVVNRIVVLSSNCPSSQPCGPFPLAYAYITVKNTGNAIAGPSQTRIVAKKWDNNQVLLIRDLPTRSLAPGASVTLMTKFSTTPRFRLTATADYFNAVPESNENDNTLNWP